jgi:hypothetical protein
MNIAIFGELHRRVLLAVWLCQKRCSRVAQFM